MSIWSTLLTFFFAMIKAPFIYSFKLLSFLYVNNSVRKLIIILLSSFIVLRDHIINALSENKISLFFFGLVQQLIASDNGIYQEVYKFTLLSDPSLKQTIISLITIWAFFYIYVFISMWFYRGFDWLDNTKPLKNFLFAIIAFLFLQTVGNIILLMSAQNLTGFEGLKTLLGDKSFIGILKVINPIKGILFLLMNIKFFLLTLHGFIP